MVLSHQISTADTVQPKDHLFRGLEWKDEGEWKGPFFFIQMADCQLGFIEENKSWVQEIALLEKAVFHINCLKPRFVILCGDITHARPNEPIREDQVRDFKMIISKIDSKIPLICVCGNHDVGNRPDSLTIATYEKDFGSHYFSFWVGGMQGIVVNSALIWDPSKAFDLYQEQLGWFTAQLELLPEGRPPIHRMVFSHHPWFLNVFDEDGGFGQDGHDESGYVIIPKERRLQFLSLMNHSNVRACFCGHYHRNNIAEYKTMPVITTSAVGKQLGKDLSGFRIVKVLLDRIEHEYVDFENVPDYVLK